MFKKVLGSLLVAGMLGANAIGVVSAAESVSITGGTLSVTQTNPTFTSVALNLVSSQTSTGSATITATDNRGSGAGWGITLQITDFETANITDPSSGGQGQFVAKIPVSAVTANVGTPALVNGQAVNATYGPKGSNITLSTAAQTLVNASPGFGMGSYTVPVDFTITIPKTVSVVSKTGTGGKYSTGDTLGIIATTYTSTFTYATIAGV